jgi:hypothetical protein
MTTDITMTINDSVADLQKGDLLRVRWKPFIRLYGRDTFLCEYKKNDQDKKTLTVCRELFDILDIKFILQRTMPYDRIESIEKLEPKKLY